MDKEIRQFFSAAKRIRLSFSEKEAMRFALEREVQEKSFVSIAVTPSMKLLEDEKSDLMNGLRQHMAMRPMTEHRTSWLGLLFQSWTHSRLVASALVVTLLVTTSTASYAAETALPDEPLYSMKIHFNERMYGYFQLSEEQRAAWDVALLQRREAEIERLLEEGRMTGDLVSFFQDRITKRKNRFEERLNRMPVERQEKMRSRIEQKVQKRMEVFQAVQDGDMTIEEVVENMRANRGKRLERIQKKKARMMENGGVRKRIIDQN